MQTQHAAPDYGNSYDRWNRALAHWAVHGSSEGTPIYLSVDEPALLTVARRFAGLACANIDEACDAFRQALIEKCVRCGPGGERRIDLSGLAGSDNDGIPRSVAFLAGMVFAAYQMADDKVADDGAYFVRLRQLFGVDPAGQNFRPRGLELRPNRPAPEESLWQTWNRWLARNGFQPTAAQGNGPKYKYSNYPISQALLRKGDKVRLARWFREQERSGALDHRSCDRDILAVRLPELGKTLGSVRLRQLFQNTEDHRRFEAVIDAAADVYDSIDWDQAADASDADLIGPRRLRAGLYRTENFITGAIEYWLYPKMPRRWQGGALAVERDGCRHELQVQRPGWFMPLWPVTLNSEQRYPITGADDITELVLPNRDFWILVHDPDDGASGILASWSVPAPGQTFLLLCQEQHARQLQVLREEQLLTWDEIIPVPQGDRVWLEYRECQVESSRWSRMLPQPGCEDLLDALRPVMRVNVALEGGLRIPGQHVWIEGHQPDLRLYQFGGAVQLRIYEANAPEQPVFEGPAAVNDQVPLPSLGPGEYVIEAGGAGCVAVRRLRIASWSQLEARPPTRDYSVPVNGFCLRGASLFPASGERR
jgi:hypothetical protein